MPLETGTTIAALNSSNPLGGDARSLGDDHIRLIKAVLKATFPGAAAGGFAIPITATEAQLNFVTGVTSSIQTQIDTKAAKGANTDITSLAPSGTITSGGAITSSAGGITATTGNIVATAGNITATAGQLISTKTWDATDGKGQFFLNGLTGNRIDFNNNGVAPPTFTTRSAGTKIALFSSVGAAAVDYAIGIEAGAMWNSVGNSGVNFKWYAGTTNIALLTGAGIFTAQGVLANTATGGVGFTTGAGGTVTQATSKATTVTLNKACGSITLNAASLAAGAVVTFTFLNSSINNQDNMILNSITGTDGAYLLSLSGVGAGTCNISIRNLTAGALAEGFVIRFSVISGSNA